MINLKGGKYEKASEITISVHLHSGDPVVFKVDATEGRERNAAARIKRSMNANYIEVDLDGKLILIPTSSIQ